MLLRKYPFELKNSRFLIRVCPFGSGFILTNDTYFGNRCHEEVVVCVLYMTHTH